MPVKKGTVLLLEGLPTVMFALSFDVANYVRELGLTYGEGAITILPSEGISAKRFVEHRLDPPFNSCTALLIERVGGMEVTRWT